MKKYDLIIIGAGPAGVTAAVYAARKRMNFIVLTDDIGGQMTWSGDIENYTGYQFITGTDLVAKFEEHIEKYDVPVKEFEVVKSLKVNESEKMVMIETESGALYAGRTVIIASGKRSRELKVEGEEQFRKRGVTYCATCDGPLYSGKKVAVVGGGNSGLEGALQLKDIAEHVYLINVTDDLTGDAVLSEKIRSAGNVTIMNNSEVKKVSGSMMVEQILVNDNGVERALDVNGVFVEIGLIPNTDFVSDIEMNDKREIIINNKNQTNFPFVFAAGDVTDVPEKQIIIAAGEGAKALLGAYTYLARVKG